MSYKYIGMIIAKQRFFLRRATRAAHWGKEQAVPATSILTWKRENETQFKVLCSLTKYHLDSEQIRQTKEELCQFILDPTSLNLNNRISLNDPILHEVFKLSRDFCFFIDKTRVGLLKKMNENSG